MTNTAFPRSVQTRLQEAARIATDRVGHLEVMIADDPECEYGAHLVEDRESLRDILHELLEALALL